MARIAAPSYRFSARTDVHLDGRGIRDFAVSSCGEISAGGPWERWAIRRQHGVAIFASLERPI